MVDGCCDKLAPLVDSPQGVVYQVESNGSDRSLKLLSAYADGSASRHADRMQMGEGLIGQCARDARRILVTQMPRNVVPISSGLFRAPPQHAMVLPVLFENEVKAVIELASLGRFTDLQLSFLDASPIPSASC